MTDQQFRFKVTISTEVIVEAENLAEAKGVVKGLAAAQLKGFKVERIDPMNLDKKIIVKEKAGA